MRGLILLKSNYSYEGDVINNEPHGNGIFSYQNGDRYIGQCKFGKLDGYGKYIYRTGAVYIGFFSYSRLHGIGTFEDKKNIYKGPWRCDKKHGMFYRTRKIDYTTFIQVWKKGKLISEKKTQYIRPELLLTIKKNPLNNKGNKKQIRYKGKNAECVGCCDNATNATNDRCGHVVMCDKCLSKCEVCPICRCPIGNIIKLFIS